ncbi:hypothetical protein V8G54_022312, partial [Vigna mungo]
MSSRTTGSKGSTFLKCLEFRCLTNMPLSFVSPNLKLTTFEVSAPHVHVVSMVITYVQFFLSSGASRLSPPATRTWKNTQQKINCPPMIFINISIFTLSTTMHLF